MASRPTRSGPVTSRSHLAILSLQSSHTGPPAVPCTGPEAGRPLFSGPCDNCLSGMIFPRHHMANVLTLSESLLSCHLPNERALLTTPTCLSPPGTLHLLTMSYVCSCLQHLTPSNLSCNLHIIALFILSPHCNGSSVRPGFFASFAHW